MAFFDTKIPQTNLASLTGLVETASRSPLSALGETMTELDAIATQRGKEKYTSDIGKQLASATSIDELLAMGIDPTRMTEAGAKQFGTTLTGLESIANIEAANRRAALGEAQLAQQGKLYKESDYVPIEGGYQRFDIDALGNRIPIGRPLTETEMLLSRGKGLPTPAKVNMVTAVDPTNPEAVPVSVPENELAIRGLVPASEARAFQTAKSVVKYIGADGKVLSGDQNKQIETALAPIVSGSKEQRNMVLDSIVEAISDEQYFGAEPDEKQASGMKQSIGEMAVNPRYGANLLNLIQSGSGAETLNLINKYRKEKGLPTYEQETDFTRALSRIFPFGSKGLETIMPSDDRSKAAAFRSIYPDAQENTTRPLDTFLQR